MTEVFEEVRVESEVSEPFEFAWPRDEVLPDMRWLRDFAKRGLPEDMRQAHEALKMLKTIEFDGTADQEVARAHINAAIELFNKSHSEWSAYALGEANRIITKYLGRIKIAGQEVLGAELIHEPNGEVRLKLLTTSPENSEVLVY